MTQPTCETCKFYHYSGTCRRRAPQVFETTSLKVVCDDSRLAIQLSEGRYAVTTFPKIPWLEWCGEHSPIPLAPQIVPGVSEHPTTNEA